MKRIVTLVITLLAVACWSHDASAATKRYPYQGCFELAARAYDVPVELLLAVAATESNWNPDARSHANAHGIMQIQWPGTARRLGFERVAELYNPCLNIDAGARYLRELLDSHNGSVGRALAAYNYGPARISVGRGAGRRAALRANGDDTSQADHDRVDEGHRQAAIRQREAPRELRIAVARDGLRQRARGAGEQRHIPFQPSGRWNVRSGDARRYRGSLDGRCFAAHDARGAGRYLRGQTPPSTLRSFVITLVTIGLANAAAR